MRRRPTRLATFFRSRTRQLVWAGSLALLGAGLLVAAHGTTDFTRDVLINLGASVAEAGYEVREQEYGAVGLAVSGARA